MDVVLQASRRKACDLCSTKKIKCDMQKPVCSNCSLYQAECITTAPVRRRKDSARSDRTKLTRSHPPPPPPPPPPLPPSSAQADLNARLARIESQLEQVLNVQAQYIDYGQIYANLSPLLNSDTTLPLPPQPQPQPQPPVITPPVSESAASSSPAAASAPADDSILLLPVADNNQPTLPPLLEILPLVNEYFQSVNFLCPIFEPGAFMEMLQAWYMTTGERSIVVWAAVQVVLGMAYQHKGLYSDNPVYEDRVNSIIQSLERLVPQLLTQTKDHLGLQVMLGLVMLHRGSNDPKPASLTIGAIVRLCHRMELNCADSVQLFSPHIALQRSRIFWIAYVLDKEISLRARTPAFQSDADIDLPLPDPCPADGLGIMVSADGGTYFNYFRSRVELSHIQGTIYDSLYSVRARKISPDDRRVRIEQLNATLEAWRAAIPPAFQLVESGGGGRSGGGLAAPDSTTTSLTDLTQLAFLYNAYMAAQLMAHGVFTHNSHWVSRVGSVFSNKQQTPEWFRNPSGSERIPIDASALLGQIAPIPPEYAATTTTTTPTTDSSDDLDVQSGWTFSHHSFPAGWLHCVGVARACLTLFLAHGPDGPILTTGMLRAVGCTFVAGLIILLSNTLMQAPGYADAAADLHIVTRSLQAFDAHGVGGAGGAATATAQEERTRGFPGMARLRHVLGELHGAAGMRLQVHTLTAHRGLMVRGGAGGEPDLRSMCPTVAAQRQQAAAMSEQALVSYGDSDLYRLG